MVSFFSRLPEKTAKLLFKKTLINLRGSIIFELESLCVINNSVYDTTVHFLNR